MLLNDLKLGMAWQWSVAYLGGKTFGVFSKTFFDQIHC